MRLQKSNILKNKTSKWIARTFLACRVVQIGCYGFKTIFKTKNCGKKLCSMMDMA